MRIVLNGAERTIPEGSTVSSLLEEMGIQAGRVAVEINLKILDPEEFARALIHEGDKVEVIGFVGGGQTQESTVSNAFK